MNYCFAIRLRFKTTLQTYLSCAGLAKDRVVVGSAGAGADAVRLTVCQTHRVRLELRPHPVQCCKIFYVVVIFD